MTKWGQAMELGQSGHQAAVCHLALWLLADYSDLEVGFCEGSGFTCGDSAWHHDRQAVGALCVPILPSSVSWAGSLGLRIPRRGRPGASLRRLWNSLGGAWGTF